MNKTAEIKKWLTEYQDANNAYVFHQILFYRLKEEDQEGAEEHEYLMEHYENKMVRLAMKIKKRKPSPSMMEKYNIEEIYSENYI